MVHKAQKQEGGVCAQCSRLEGKAYQLKVYAENQRLATHPTASLLSALSKTSSHLVTEWSVGLLITTQPCCSGPSSQLKAWARSQQDFSKETGKQDEASGQRPGSGTGQPPCEGPMGISRWTPGPAPRLLAASVWEPPAGTW